MDEGLGRLTIERVAAEAGVGKPTIYRTWTNAQELAMAAFMAQPADAGAAPALTLGARGVGRPPRLGDPRRSPQPRPADHADDGRGRPRQRARQGVPEPGDPEEPRGRPALIERAVQGGEMRAAADVETVLDMVYGPLFFRLLAGHLPLSAGVRRAARRHAVRRCAPARRISAGAGSGSRCPSAGRPAACTSP